MVDVGLKGVGVLYRINKDEGNESMSLLPFPGDVDRSFSSCLGIRNIPSDVCYDNAKYYQIQSSSSN